MLLRQAGLSVFGAYRQASLSPVYVYFYLYTEQHQAARFAAFDFGLDAFAFASLLALAISANTVPNRA